MMKLALNSDNKVKRIFHEYLEAWRRQAPERRVNAEWIIKGKRKHGNDPIGTMMNTANEIGITLKVENSTMIIIYDGIEYETIKD